MNLHPALNVPFQAWETVKLEYMEGALNTFATYRQKLIDYFTLQLRYASQAVRPNDSCYFPAVSYTVL